MISIRGFVHVYTCGVVYLCGMWYVCGTWWFEVECVAEAGIWGFGPRLVELLGAALEPVGGRGLLEDVHY